MAIELDEDIILGLKTLSSGCVANNDYMSNLNENDIELADDAIHWIESLPDLSDFPESEEEEDE